MDKHAQHYTRPILTSLLNSHCPSVLPVLGHVSLLEWLCMVWTDMIALGGIFFRARRYVLIQEELRHSSSAANRQMWFGSQSSLLAAMRKVIELNLRTEARIDIFGSKALNHDCEYGPYGHWELNHPSSSIRPRVATFSIANRQDQGHEKTTFSKPRPQLLVLKKKKTQAQCSNFPNFLAFPWHTMV